MHFNSPQWVCLWNKRRKRTLQVINPFNSPAPAPHASADNTAVPQNRPGRERMPVDCFTGVALWNIYINDKRTILLDHEAHWQSPFCKVHPSLVVRGRLHVAVIVGVCTVPGKWQNESLYNGQWAHRYCIISKDGGFFVFQVYCNLELYPPMGNCVRVLKDKTIDSWTYHVISGVNEEVQFLKARLQLSVDITLCYFVLIQAHGAYFLYNQWTWNCNNMHR